MYTLDTNAIIYFLKDDAKAVTFLRNIFEQNIPLYVSAITEVELFGFPKLEFQETETIKNVLRTVTIIPLDSRLARLAGFVRRTYGLKVSDSVIAATALATGTTLLTRNTRDFQKIPNLAVQAI